MACQVTGMITGSDFAAEGAGAGSKLMLIISVSGGCGNKVSSTEVAEIPWDLAGYDPIVIKPRTMKISGF